jgi:hypothetical protein
MEHRTWNRWSLFLISYLLLIPFACQASFLDEFFEDFDEFFSEDNLGSQNGGSQIINEVNVSTNTGGNKADSGEVIEGESKSEVHIKNIINGNEIEPIDIESSSSEVKVEEKIEVDNDKADISREIEIGSEKTEENYQVDLTSEEEIKEEPQNAVSQEEVNESQPTDGEELSQQKNLKFAEKIYFSFVENLKSFFKNIFNKLI